MPMTMRVTLPGYDCLTDGTIDHYSIYADSDNVLIKELTRGTKAVANATSGTVAHNLGYIPFYLAYAQVSSTRYRIASAFDPVGSGWQSSVNGTNIIFKNNFGTAGTVVRYYVFYDTP